LQSRGRERKILTICRKGYGGGADHQPYRGHRGVDGAYLVTEGVMLVWWLPSYSDKELTDTTVTGTDVSAFLAVLRQTSRLKGKQS
jgi:hypothetical protein